MKACIVIPCYNEAGRLREDVFLTFLDRYADIDFCFVNDGSSDDTEGVLQSVSAKREGRMIVVTYPDNQGKAEAVRRGFLHVSALYSYDAIAFADADLATPLKEMKRLIDVFERQAGVVLVMGSRIERMGVVIRRKLYRHFSGRIFAAVVSVLFRLNAYDTQCGAKVFAPRVVEEVFHEPFLSHWLFDIEILLRLRNRYANYNEIIHEIPLDVWIEQGNSKIRPLHLLKMPGQLLRIFFKYRKRDKDCIG